MSDPVAEAYDAVLYLGAAVKASHPRNLETLATLHGLEPAPIPSARVLEIGCATGGNLLPQAVQHPGARFVGIDVSPRQIEYAEGIAKAVGVSNLELRLAGVGDVDSSWGAFDYILCHGVYSWVSTDVQTELLRVFRENLAPHGVVYVSYNVLPGWYMRQAARDLMLYHTAPIRDPTQKIAQARAILGTLVEARGEDASAYVRAFREEAAIVGKSPDPYIFHEHLEQDNRPVYFHDFDARVQASGLQYLAEAEFKQNFATDLPASIRDQVESLPHLRQQQYLDFLRGRQMRRSLLCRDDAEVTRPMDPRVVDRLHVSLTKVEGFEVVDSGEDSIFAATLDRLEAHHPRPVPVAALRAMVPGTSDEASERGADPLADPLTRFLWLSLVHGGIEACVHPPLITFEVSERPRVSPLVRIEAEIGERATTGFHGVVGLDEMGRLLVAHLDGAHDRDALVARVAQAVAAGDFELVPDPKHPDEAPDPGRAVDRMLARMAAIGLLVG